MNLLLNAASEAANRVATSMTKLQTAAASTASTKATSTGTGSTVTSADFLTLLVSELKNQDPTQPTDPNAYVQQLVGVNSLQQLIDINQELGAVSGTKPADATEAIR